VLSIVLCGAMPPVDRVSAYLRLIVTSEFEIIVTDLEKGIISYSLNIFMKGKEIDCHPSRVIHVLRSIPCHPPLVIHLWSSIHIQSRSISSHKPSPDGIHLLSSISGRNPTLAAIRLLAIHLASAIRFHPVRYCARMRRVP